MLKALGMATLATAYPFSLGCAKPDDDDENGKVPGGNGNNGTGYLVGKVLPDWEEGYLDIHTINTGRGESTLYIFPDGTTMLVDAAGSLMNDMLANGDEDADDGVPPTPPKPSISVTSGQAITNYVNYFAKAASNKLNYILLTHFHGDHMGTYAATLPMAPSADFRMNGITEVGAKVKFDKILDRGYPNYNFPTNLAATAMVGNYIKFVNWSKAAYGATAEQFDVGKTDQIVLKQNPSKYNNFQIRNIVGNGKVWTGTGVEVTNMLPDASVINAATYKNENIFSIGFQLKYGRFNYFAGADLQYTNRSLYPWLDVEKPVADVVTAVDVMKANHHCTSNCNSDVLVEKLNPKVVLVHAWREKHPYPATTKRFYDKSTDIFSTCVMDANKVLLNNYTSRIRSMQGHIVVRVSPSALQYTVYVLDDSNEEYKIKGIFGPYQCN
jgi:beta-lactamase superfamily II metal-dependent hydrolase